MKRMGVAFIAFVRISALSASSMWEVGVLSDQIVGSLWAGVPVSRQPLEKMVHFLEDRHSDDCEKKSSEPDHSSYSSCSDLIDSCGVLIEEIDLGRGGKAEHQKNIKNFISTLHSLFDHYERLDVLKRVLFILVEKY